MKINYSHNYYKLSNKFYTTIRKSIKANQKKDNIETECIRGCISHKAIILKIEKIILDNLPESILIMDCVYPNSNIKSREDCYALIQSFYYNPIDFKTQEFYLFFMYQI